MFGPTEQVFQAHDQQPTVTGGVVDSLGALAPALLFTGRRRQVLLGLLKVGGLGIGQVLGWV
ncbi:hypothetical protein D3C80_1827860 [compost metagenome]